MVVKPWSILDFVLIWLGGIFGTSLTAGLAFAFVDRELLVMLGLAGQLLGNLVVFLILRRRRPPIGLELRGSDIGFAGLGLLLQIAIALALLPLANLLFPDGQPPQQLAEILTEAESPMLKIGLLASAVLFGPLVEEVMYRGVLLRALEPRGPRLAIVVSALAFSAFHVIGLQSDRLLAASALVLPPLFLLGLVLGWLTQRADGRLGPAIMFHSGWNLLAAISLLIPQELLEQAA